MLYYFTGMYKVVLTKKCANDLLKLKKSGFLSEDDLLTIRTWINEISIYGPEYIFTCGHWNDHQLKDERSGQRSSSFSQSGRSIYRIKNNKITITVLKITVDHDYR